MRAGQINFARVAETAPVNTIGELVMTREYTSTIEPWDPLLLEDDDPGWVEAAQRREIRNILKSYTGYYDAFAEIIQNALDAVERRAGENDPNYTPTIWITIDLVLSQSEIDG